MTPKQTSKSFDNSTETLIHTKQIKRGRDNLNKHIWHTNSKDEKITVTAGLCQQGYFDH